MRALVFDKSTGLWLENSRNKHIILSAEAMESLISKFNHGGGMAKLWY